MARMNREELLAAAAENMSAQPDPSGKADLVSEKGAIIAACLLYTSDAADE